MIKTKLKKFIYYDLAIFIIFVLICISTRVLPITMTFAKNLQIPTYHTNSKYGVNHGYTSYENPSLDIMLEYPSEWKIYEADGSILSALRGLVYFEIPYEGHNIGGTVSNQNDFVNNPAVTIIAEKLPSRNISLSDYIKIQYDNLKQLFSDYDLKINNGSIDDGTIQNRISIINGYPTASIEYSINTDPFKNNNYKTNVRNGFELWLIKDETVYTITYIASIDIYPSILPKVQKMIDSIKFIDIK